MTRMRLVISIAIAVASLFGIVIGTLGLAVLFSVDLPTLLTVPAAARNSFILWSFIALLVSWILFFLERTAMISELRIRLDARRELQLALDGLAVLRSEGVNDLYAGTPPRKEFADWVKRFQDWEQRVVEYMKPRFTAAIVGLFSELGAVPAISFSHASKDRRIRKKHQAVLRMLAKELAILERVIQQGSLLVHEPTPTIWEILWQRQQGG